MLRGSLLLLLSILVTLALFAVGRAAPVEQATPPPATFPLIVTVQRSANVRAGPGTEFPIISSAKPGQRLAVIGCNSDCSWYQLAEDCWIAAFLVKPEQPLAPLPATGEPSTPAVEMNIPITVSGIPTQTIQATRCPQTSAEVNTYAGPGTFYPVVDTRPAGECIAAVGRNAAGDWLQLSHGMWIAAAAILYAEPIELLPITDRIFTATPEPTHTPIPTATPTPTPTTDLTAIRTVGEWVAASDEQKSINTLIWTQALVDQGIVTGDAVAFAAELYACLNKTIEGTMEILGESYAISEVAAGCIVTLVE